MINIDSSVSIAGVANITVSKVNDTIFISNNNLVLPGMPGSIAIYNTDQGELTSSGESLLWNNDKQCLFLNNLNSNNIESHKITTINAECKRIEASYIQAKDLNVNNIEILSNFFETKKVKAEQFIISEDDNARSMIHYSSTENFVVCTETINNPNISIDVNNRVTIKRLLNILPADNGPLAIGSKYDKKGDIIFTRQYLYYCIENYDGYTNIWVRWSVTETNW